MKGISYYHDQYRNGRLRRGRIRDRESLNRIARRIRETLIKAIDPVYMAAALHSVAHEMSPQRIWQASLGQRHILVTTWGIYDVDFGFGPGIRYADAALPAIDGGVLVRESLPSLSVSESSSCADNRMDVTIYLHAQVLERLLLGTELLPV
ncbi:transferase family protein [Apiospora phragmitis]|uniref:Transferase family protein n=1 Tax=Apiospora phragmitis TaxID=2905665 RepID=A0ABR1W626_9PEZI